MAWRGLLPDRERVGWRRLAGMNSSGIIQEYAILAMVTDKEDSSDAHCRWRKAGRRSLGRAGAGRVLTPELAGVCAISGRRVRTGRFKRWAGDHRIALLRSFARHSGVQVHLLGFTKHRHAVPTGDALLLCWRLLCVPAMTGAKQFDACYPQAERAAGRYSRGT